MKLNEIITEATKQDYVGCDADSILAQAQTSATVRPRPPTFMNNLVSAI